MQLPSLQLPGTGTDLLISSYVVAGSICNYMYLNSARFSCLVSEILIIFEAKCGKAHLYDVNIGGVKKKCLSDLIVDLVSLKVESSCKMRLPVCTHSSFMYINSIDANTILLLVYTK